MSRPLAEVVPMVTVAGGYGGIRIGGAKGPTWGVNGGLFDRSHDPPAAAVAESLAHDINAAHAAVVEPLHARLAVAREALDRLDARVVGLVPHDDPAVLAAVNALAAIDAEPPPEVVPLEKYKQLEAVLGDALEFTEAKKWRGRCERALTFLKENDGLLWPKTEQVGAILRGHLEGRDEPGPAKVPGSPDERAYVERLQHRLGIDGSDAAALARAWGVVDPEEP